MVDFRTLSSEWVPISVRCDYVVIFDGDKCKRLLRYVTEETHQAAFIVNLWDDCLFWQAVGGGAGHAVFVNLVGRLDKNNIKIQSAAATFIFVTSEPQHQLSQKPRRLDLPQEEHADDALMLRSIMERTGSYVSALVNIKSAGKIEPWSSNSKPGTKQSVSARLGTASIGKQQCDTAAPKGNSRAATVVPHCSSCCCCPLLLPPLSPAAGGSSR